MREIKVLEYDTNESFKFYKEFYKAVKEFFSFINTVWKARKIIRRIKKYTPENWHIYFYYSDCTESSINFSHNRFTKKDIKPSHVFKKLHDNLIKELGIKFIKDYGEWDEKLESIQAHSHYKGFGIHIYQYQVEECTFIVEEVKQKKVVLTGDCVNF